MHKTAVVHTTDFTSFCNVKCFVALSAVQYILNYLFKCEQLDHREN